MAWAIGNVQNGTLTIGSPATSVVMTAPTGIVNGALLFAALITDIAAGGDPGVPSLSGFTQITSLYRPAVFKGSTRLTTWYKIAASESGNYTASWTSSAQASWGIVCITGNKATSPVDVSATAANDSGTGSTIVSPSLSGLTQTNDLLLNVFSGPGGDNPYTDPASGLTMLFDNQAANADSGYLSMGYQALSSAAATTQYTVTPAFPNNSQTMAVAFLASGGAAPSNFVPYNPWQQVAPLIAQ